MIKIYDKELFNKVKEKGNLCLCTVEDTECICEEFKKQKEGLCHCKVYIKTSGE